MSVVLRPQPLLESLLGRGQMTNTGFIISNQPNNGAQGQKENPTPKLLSSLLLWFSAASIQSTTSLQPTTTLLQVRCPVALGRGSQIQALASGSYQEALGGVYF